MTAPTAPLAPIDLHQRYSIPEVLAYRRESRKRFYEHVSAGRIAIIKDGRRSFVSGDELARSCRAGAP
jgi:hypothetical protein